MLQQIYYENLRLLKRKKLNKQKLKKGRVILVKVIAKSIFSGSPTNPGAIKLIKIGIKSSITKTKKNKPINNKLKI